METTQVPINRWMDKENYIYIYIYMYIFLYIIYIIYIYIYIMMGYHSAIKKKNEILSFVTTMDGPWRYYAKWNKSEGERQILQNFTHVCNIKKQIK